MAWRQYKHVLAPVVASAFVLAQMLSSGVVVAATPGLDAPPISGPLRVLSGNSHYFTDDTGRAIVLTGSHTWDDFQDTDQSGQPAAFNFEAFVGFLTAHGQNMTILWKKDLPTYCNWGAGGTWHMSQFPWVRTGPGNATDGKPKFDLSNFDQGYFDRLRARAVLLQQNNIYATVQLFDGLGLSVNRCGQDGFPLSRANNVNGVDDGGGTGSITMHNANAVTAVQDAYVKKTIDTLNDLSNVLWETSEEAPSSAWWEDHMTSLIHSYEADKPLQHPVGYASALADWTTSGSKIASPNNGSRVLINDSDHTYFGMWNDSAQQNRNFVWQNFTNGAPVLFMDPYVILWSSGKRNICQSPAHGVCSGPDGRWDNMRDNLGYTLAYANRMNLAAMTPQGKRTSTGFALANTASTGSEYLVYAPNGGAFTVDLSNTSASLNVEWLSPASGARTAAGTVSGGSSAQSFTPPFGGDAVLYLVDATAPVAPSPPPDTTPAPPPDVTPPAAPDMAPPVPTDTAPEEMQPAPMDDGR